MSSSDHDPLHIARSLRDLILDNRQETEQGRQLAEPIVDALIETKLCRLALPRDDGGLETSPLEALAVYEELAEAEASVAWIVWNNSLICWFARHMPPNVRKDLFGDPENLFAGSTRPTGKAIADSNGYRVSGRWALVSGCTHARWIPVLCIVEKDGEVQMQAPGVPQLLMAVVPQDRYEILDTWHVGGLRGTGSHDVVLQDETVPAERLFSPFAGPSYIESPFGRVPIVVTMAAGCASVCLGIARAASNAIVELAKSKVSPDAGPGMRDRPQTQASVARTTTMLGALRSNLHASYGELWKQVESGLTVSPGQLADAWSAAIMTARECRSAVSEIYALGGVASLYTDNPIERAHRDIHAVQQHIAVQPFWLEEAGRVKLGLESRHPLFAV